MEGYIKILEEFIKYFEAEAISRKYRRNISITVGEDDIQAIENLIKGYRELERKFKIKTGDVEYLENKIRKHFIDDFTLQRDYTPKSKIKEKIEECRRLKFKDERLDKVTIDFILNKIQELMEDK